MRLDFGEVKRHSTPRNRRMERRMIKRVQIEFEDGSIEAHEIPESQGFFRERYTYEQREIEVEGRMPVSVNGPKLYCFEIFWTLKQSQVEGNSSEDGIRTV